MRSEIRLERGVVMNEKEIRGQIIEWFNACNNKEEVSKMYTIICDVTEEEKENRVYDLWRGY